MHGVVRSADKPLAPSGRQGAHANSCAMSTCAARSLPFGSLDRRSPIAVVQAAGIHGGDRQRARPLARFTLARFKPPAALAKCLAIGLARLPRAIRFGPLWRCRRSKVAMPKE